MLRGLQDAAEEEQVIDDINNNDVPVDDGGSSKKLSQGEIIFVTVLTFIIFLALILGIYCYIQRKKRKSQEESQIVADGSNKELKEEQAPASVIDIGGVHQHSSHHGGSNHPSSRQQERRKSTRRSSNGSIGSGSVGSDYKKAAIDHMNSTLSSGRH